MKKIFFFFLVLFSVLFSLASEDADSWFARSQYYSPVGASSRFSTFQLCGDYVSAQLSAVRFLRLNYTVSSATYSVPVSDGPLVSNSVSGVTFSGSQTLTSELPLYSVVVQLVRTVAGQGFNPSIASSSVITNAGVVYYTNFQSYNYLSLAWFSSADYRSSISSLLSRLDSNSSNILTSVMGIASDTANITNILSVVSSSLNDEIRSLYRMEEQLNGIYGSIPPSTTLSAMLDVLKNIVYDGNFTSADLQSLPPEMRSHIMSYNGELLPLDDVGRSFVQSLYQDVSSGIAMYQQMKGYTISSSGVTFSGNKDDVTINGNDLSLSSFLKTSPLEQFALHSQVSMAVDTNNIKRIGGDIRDLMGRILRPESSENQQKRQLDSAAVADAMRSEFANDGLKVRFNEPLQVSVMNWPEGGLNVSLDAPSISSLGAVFGDALSGVDRTLTSLMQDFNMWSGVDDGGRWLGVQDCLMTNIPLIVDGLLSLTNNFTNISNNLENVSSNELAQLSSELESRQDSAIAQEDSLISSFNAESYIAFAHIDQFNLSDRQNFGLLNTMANDMGVNRPDIVQINIPDFGDVHIQPIYIRVAPLFNLLEVVRWFFRCFYVLIFIGTLVMIFRLFLFSVKLLRRFTDLPLVVR